MRRSARRSSRAPAAPRARSRGSGACAECLVDEVHLQVADDRPAAQVVLAHEAVERDRRSSAGIALVVRDFGHRSPVRARARPAGALVRSSVLPSGMSTTTWNSDLLSNGSIFRITALDADEATGGERPAARSRRTAAPAPRRARAVEEGRHHALEETTQARQPSASSASPSQSARDACSSFSASHGVTDQRDRERQQHAGGGVDRNRPHVRAHQARHERHRQQRGDHGEGREDRRPADLADRSRNRLAQASARRAPCGGGCSRPRRSRRRRGCRSRRSARTATRG